MYATVRPLGLQIKGYAALLAVVSTAAVVAGGAINFTYARNNPGADPYMPRPQLVVPLAPVEPVAPQPKVIPLGGADPEQAPLVSRRDAPAEQMTGTVVHTAPAIGNAMAVRAGHVAPEAPAAVGGMLQSSAPSSGCFTADSTKRIPRGATADLDCRASGAVGQGAIGEMTIGAGSVTVVPTQ